MDRFDERDTIFSRMELIAGSEKYETYYAGRPDLKQVDDQFRNTNSGLYKREWIEMARIDSAFRLLKKFRPLAAQSAGRKGTDFPSDQKSLKAITRELRETALEYGAVLYGETVLGMECFYSVRGRGGLYGKPVIDPLRNALVFAVEMDREKVSRAPRPVEAKEVTRGYIRVVIIGLILSYFLRELGYEARCHTEGESELILPAAARAAGLGEMGRLGLLLTEDYGPVIRLGAVTTSFPLTSLNENDPAQVSSLADFCATCDLCARHCPGKAISREPAFQNSSCPEKQIVPWKTNQEACFSMWNKFGTDCGICLAVCPYGN